MSSAPSSRFSRRALLGAAAGVALGTGAVACRDSPAPSLDSMITELSRSLSRKQPYRPPSVGEAEAVAAGVALLSTVGIDAARDGLIHGGFTATALHDGRSARDLVIARSELGTDRAWGMVALSPAMSRPRVVIEVPHPVADLETELVGMELFRALPDSVLLIAGAHRHAAHDEADVAHRSDSLFHRLAVQFGRGGADEVQLHGFADTSLPGNDAVVSTGQARHSALADAVANGIGGGLTVCRGWSHRCGNLEGKSNAQGAVAEQDRRTWVHVELSRSVRSDPQRRASVVAALAEAVRHGSS